MEKVKLSDLIAFYKNKVSNKNEFFGYFFEENALESKLSRLEIMYKTLGDVIMPIDYFKTFLYAGHWYGKDEYYDFDVFMIKDIYDIIREYDDMPVVLIDNLLLLYDKECFEKYNVKEYFHYLISEFQYSEEVSIRYSKFIRTLQKLLTELYKQESQKLNEYKDIYGFMFIQRLQSIILKRHISADSIIELLPSKEFINNSSVITPYNYSIESGEDIVARIAMGYVDIDEYDDNDYMILGITSTDDYVYTSFTKKEYLDELEKQKGKKLEKKR